MSSYHIDTQEGLNLFIKTVGGYFEDQVWAHVDHLSDIIAMSETKWVKNHENVWETVRNMAVNGEDDNEIKFFIMFDDEGMCRSIGFQNLTKRCIGQYFFDNNKPAGMNLGHIQSPTWHLNRPPLGEGYRLVFDELNDLPEPSPESTASMMMCLAHLLIPGPDYECGEGLPGISLKLKR